MSPSFPGCFSNFYLTAQMQNQKGGNLVRFGATNPLKLAILFSYFILLCTHTKRDIILLKHAASLKLQRGPHSHIPSPLLSHCTTPEVQNRPSCNSTQLQRMYQNQPIHNVFTADKVRGQVFLPPRRATSLSRRTNSLILVISRKLAYLTALGVSVSQATFNRPPDGHMKGEGLL